MKSKKQLINMLYIQSYFNYGPNGVLLYVVFL